MTREVRWRPSAHADLTEAHAWYTERSETAARTLLAETWSTIARVAASPRQFPMLEGAVRRALLPSFPYAIHFREHLRGLIVLGFTHTHRAPRRWD